MNEIIIEMEHAKTKEKFTLAFYNTTYDKIKLIVTKYNIQCQIGYKVTLLTFLRKAGLEVNMVEPVMENNKIIEERVIH